MATKTGVLGWKDIGFLGRTSRGDKEGGVDLYVNNQLECMDLHLGMNEELTKKLWVRIKESTGTGDSVVGVCYGPPDQGD